MRDFVNHLFLGKDMTRDSYQKDAVKFFCFVFLPTYAQLVIPNDDMANPDQKSVIIIIGLNVVAMIYQIINLTEEFKSFYNRENRLDYFDRQNIGDVSGILFHLIYGSLRIAYPFGGNIALFADPEDATGVNPVEYWMPALSVLLLFLLLLQFMFFITTFETMAKWIQLFWKGLKDISGFFILFALFIAHFNFVFTALGVMFDDGKNFSKDYDSDLNDYKNLDSWLVGIVQLFRSSVGDL